MSEPLQNLSDGSSSPALLQSRAITKKFGDFTALDGVDFTLRSGEIHALLGENGAGKTTLMNVLSGTFGPTDGEVVLLGKAVQWRGPQDAAVRGGIGMVHQHFQLVPVFTVLENLTLAVQNSGLLLNTKSVETKGIDLAGNLGWRIPMRTRTGDLSVGAQQRVEIIKALLLDPRILFFDEPTAVLTPSEADELFVVLRSLRDRGTSIVFVSHKLGEVKSLCDSVTILRRGKRVGRAVMSQVDEAQLARLMVGTDIVSVAAAQPPRSDAKVVLEVDGLNCDPIGRDDIALHDISFRVHEGEILGIAGVDGNGQTELFEALLGLRPIRRIDLAAGAQSTDDAQHAIRLAGVESGFSLSPSKLIASGVAAIPPDRRREGLALSQSVERNLMLTAVQSRAMRFGPFLRPRRLRDLANSWIGEYDIRTPSLRIPSTSLSGGNQQKIVVARAVAQRPRLLIAASPTRGLDVGATAYVHQKLRECQTRKSAIVLISSELDEIRELADRIAVIYEGRLIGIVSADAPTEQLGLMMGGRPAADATPS